MAVRFIQEAKVAVNKVQRIPKNRLIPRIYLGIKKKLTNYPQYITLQTVSACNLKCKHCFINNYKAEIPDGIVKIMKYEEFLECSKRLEVIIKHASHFCFSTFEAFMNKNLFRMMDHLLTINPQLQFSFNSNAMLLNELLVERLATYPVSDITISLDGMTKEVVENFKTGVQFEKIIETIRLLSNSKLKNRLTVTFVAHKNNIAQLPDYVDFVHELGVHTIAVNNILTFTPQNAHLALYTPEGNEIAENLFNEAILRAKKNKQVIQLPLLKPEVKGCQAVENFYIDVQGNVAPCDFLAVSTPFTLFGKTVQNPPLFFGNIFREDPLAIYRSEKYQQFRQAHRTGQNLPEQCTNCIDSYGLMCSNRRVFE